MSGRTPCQNWNDSAACSTSIPPGYVQCTHSGSSVEIGGALAEKGDARHVVRATKVDGAQAGLDGPRTRDAGICVKGVAAESA